jgi:hypothetical protein
MNEKGEELKACSLLVDCIEERSSTISTSSDTQSLDTEKQAIMFHPIPLKKHSTTSYFLRL